MTALPALAPAPGSCPACDGDLHYHGSGDGLRACWECRWLEKEQPYVVRDGDLYDCGCEIRTYPAGQEHVRCDCPAWHCQYGMERLIHEGDPTLP